MRSAFSETLVLLDLAYVRQDSQNYKKKYQSSDGGPYVQGYQECPQMKTSSYWRHMYNKVFISEPQCDKMYIFSYLFYFVGGGGV